MSGGVDSSVAAALMVDRGFEAVGVTMHLAGESSRCCSLADADDARRVAEALGIRFFVANYTDRFRTEVKEAFADAYLAGRTPIPCVVCNSRFKFAYLIERAHVFGASAVASGHYARVDVDPETGLRRLRRAADADKDQTYFLFELTQEQLAALHFPLGELEKPQVRAIARRLGLATADKPESQEICFVPDGDYAKLIERLRPDAVGRAGDIVDESGKLLGRHLGIHHFTVGQRHGLGISANRRLYVVRLDPRAQQVIVGDVTDLDCRGAWADQVNWIAGVAPQKPVRVRVQIRHRHRASLALVEATQGGRTRIRGKWTDARILRRRKSKRYGQLKI